MNGFRLFLVMVFLWCGVAFGQTYYYPSPINSSNGRPLNNQTIALYDATADTAVVTLTYATGSDGRYYSTSVIPNGVYTAKININGTWTAIKGHVNVAIERYGLDHLRAIVGDSVAVLAGDNVTMSFSTGVGKVLYSGVTDSLPDFYSRNYANLQALIDAIEAQTGGVGYLKKNGLQKTYTLTDSLTINEESIILDGGSRTGTMLKQTTSSDIFRTGGNHIHTVLRNMWLQGTGKQDSSKAIYQTDLGNGADLFVDDVRIDSFGVAVGGYDATNVWVNRSFLQYNKVGMAVGYQGDGWLTTATKFYDSDTAIYIGYKTATNTAGPVTAIQAIFGRDTVEVYANKETDVYNQIGSYSEDSHHLYMQRDIAGASVGNTANFIGNYSQGAKVSGFEINNPGRTTLIGNLINTGGLNDDFAVDIANGGSTARLVMFNNLFTGGQDSVRFQANHTNHANDFIIANERLRMWFNGTPLASDNDPIFQITAPNMANKEFFKIQRMNDGDGAQQYEVTAEDIGNNPFLKFSDGGVIIGEEASLPTASATYKGAVMHSADKFWLCVDDGGGGYEWQEVATVSTSDTTWHTVHSGDWFKHNAAGYGDVTDTTWTDGYDRAGVYFPDAALSAMQFYLTPEKTIASSASIFVDIYWRARSATSGAVVWGGQYASQGEGAAGSFSTAQTTTETTSGTATSLTRTRVTLTVTSAIPTKEFLIIRPRRAGTDGSDTMTDKAIVQYIRVGYL